MSEISLWTWVAVLAALMLGYSRRPFWLGQAMAGTVRQAPPRLSYGSRLPCHRAARPGARHVSKADGSECRHHRNSLRPRLLVSAARRSRARHPHSRESSGAPGLAPEHREQALLALAQDYLRSGLLDRAETLFQEVSEVPRLRAIALESLRGVYERQHEWQQALDTYRNLARIKAAPPKFVAAHYLCEIAGLALERGETLVAREPSAPGAARDRALSARRHHSRPDRGARCAAGIGHAPIARRIGRGSGASAGGAAAFVEACGPGAARSGARGDGGAGSIASFRGVEAPGVRCDCGRFDRRRAVAAGRRNRYSKAIRL